MRKALISLVTSAAMVFVSVTAIAADTPRTASANAPVVSTLAPGGAAGVKEAQDIGDIPALWLVGFAVVLTFGIIALVNNGNDNLTPAPPATGTTSTTTTTSTTATGTTP